MHSPLVSWIILLSCITLVVLFCFEDKINAYFDKE